MSDGFDRKYNPLKLTSTVIEDIPAFASLRPFRVVESNGEDRIHIAANNGDPTDGLIVNSSKPIPTGGDGWGRPTHNGMTFWVLYSGSVISGDEVGPVFSEWEFSREGRGYTVLKVNDSAGIIECIALPAKRPLRFFELQQDLRECGGGALAWELGKRTHESENYWERLDLNGDGSPDSIVWPGHEWRGIAFGSLENPGSEGGETRGEVVRAFVNDEAPGARDFLIALGTGHTALWILPDQDYAEGEVGSGICRSAGPLATVHPGDCGTKELPESWGVYFGISDVLYLQPVKADGTFHCLAVWSNQQWLARPVRVAPGCGLMVESDTESEDFGKVVIDPDAIGCGLTFEDCELAVDVAALVGGAGGCLTVEPGDPGDPESCDTLTLDNGALAGTDLEPEGECGVRLSQQRGNQIDANTADIATIFDILDTIFDTLTKLVECCEDSRECCYESMLCCYEQQTALDYIADYCCDGVPGAGSSDCGGQCLWRWNGTGWDKIVPCAGDASCDCDPPTEPGLDVGDLEQTACTDGGGGGGGTPENRCVYECNLNSWLFKCCTGCADPGPPPFNCVFGGENDNKFAVYDCDAMSWSISDTDPGC